MAMKTFEDEYLDVPYDAPYEGSSNCSPIERRPVNHAYLSRNTNDEQDLEFIEREDRSLKTPNKNRSMSAEIESSLAEDEIAVLSRLNWFFPDHVSQSARVLIAMLLHPDPMLRPSATEAIGHLWCINGSSSNESSHNQALNIENNSEINPKSSCCECKSEDCIENQCINDGIGTDVSILNRECEQIHQNTGAYMHGRQLFPVTVDESALRNRLINEEYEDHEAELIIGGLESSLSSTVLL